MRLYEGHQGGEPLTVEQHTAVLRDFLSTSLQSLSRLGFYHALTTGDDPGATTEYLGGYMEETLQAFIDHQNWLNQNGLDIALQVDEQNVYEVMGVAVESDTLGLVARIADPRTREILPVPVEDVAQFSVYLRSPGQYQQYR